MPEPQRLPRPASHGGEPPCGGPRSRSLPVVLSTDELRALLRAPVGPGAVRDVALLQVLYATACRRSELCAMRWEGLDRRRMRLRFFRPKTRDWHEVPISAGALEAIYRLRSTVRSTVLRGVIFVGQRGPLTPNGVWRIVDRWGRAAGIAAVKARPHVLRHSRAVHLIEHGCALVAVKELLGHASLAVTSQYLRVASGWVEDQIRGASTD